jgi:hypothetical protein
MRRHRSVICTVLPGWCAQPVCCVLRVCLDTALVAPLPCWSCHGTESAAAAALREAEAAILEAERAQQLALEELQKSRRQPQQEQQKKGWW